MNKQDIDKAAAALTGAINYFAPMVVALNRADEVFAVLSNALKLKESLDVELPRLKKEIADTKQEFKNISLALESAMTSNKENAEKVIEQARKDIEEAKAKADVEVVEIKKSVAERTKKAIVDSEAKIALATQEAQEAQTASQESIAVLQNSKTELEKEVSDLEAKLTTLKKQAQKFAAFLVD
jgi:chromosome segregation ATPase